MMLDRMIWAVPLALMGTPAAAAFVSANINVEGIAELVSIDPQLTATYWTWTTRRPRLALEVSGQEGTFANASFLGGEPTPDRVTLGAGVGAAPASRAFAQVQTSGVKVISVRNDTDENRVFAFRFGGTIGGAADLLPAGAFNPFTGARVKGLFQFDFTCPSCGVPIASVSSSVIEQAAGRRFGAPGLIGFSGSFFIPPTLYEVALDPGGTFDVFFSGLAEAEAVQGIPEPASWGMMIAGFGLVGGALRRRRALAGA